MKRLLWIVVMLVFVFVPCSFADSFQITQVTGWMDGYIGWSGIDNIVFTFTGPGITFQASGFMMCYPWCYIDQGLQPDTSSYIGDIFVTSLFGPVTIGERPTMSSKATYIAFIAFLTTVTHRLSYLLDNTVRS
jgi:hypothetical protein